MLAGFRFNVSHQEIERILSEVEAWYWAANEQAGVEWLPMDGINNFLFNDLGYEDIDEFEDAIQGTFQEFLDAFPHIETREVDGKWMLKIRKVEPGPARRLHVTVTSTKQLVDTTFMQANDADVEIPALEFCIGADQKRRIDFLYNHIAVAQQNLEGHAKLLGEGSVEASKIMETVAALSKLLDVEEAFEVVVNDPSGLSEFHPADAVRVELAETDAGASANSTS
mmetsp:Transcript_4504/g.11327  ORF Transcript_4504/g.11327 Transcript_4504/m.11327 type:complete len:225 (-) Transcript_4504:418-1092(-)